MLCLNLMIALVSGSMSNNDAAIIGGVIGGVIGLIVLVVMFIAIIFGKQCRNVYNSSINPT